MLLMLLELHINNLFHIIITLYYTVKSYHTLMSLYFTNLLPAVHRVLQTHNLHYANSFIHAWHPRNAFIPWKHRRTKQDHRHRLITGWAQKPLQNKSKKYKKNAKLTQHTHRNANNMQKTHAKKNNKQKNNNRRKKNRNHT